MWEWRILCFSNHGHRHVSFYLPVVPATSNSDLNRVHIYTWTTTRRSGHGGNGAPHKAGKARGSKAQKRKRGPQAGKNRQARKEGAKRQEEPHERTKSKVDQGGRSLYPLPRSARLCQGWSLREGRARQGFALAMLQPPVVDRKLTGAQPSCRRARSKSGLQNSYIFGGGRLGFIHSEHIICIRKSSYPAAATARRIRRAQCPG